jgi:sugar phosphate isomerase/epimerase
MTNSIKGPALFLAQFLGDEAPFNSLPAIVEWAAGLGYKGVQIPSWDARVFDLDKAASSKDYCDEVAGICAEYGVTITELSCHLQSQIVAVHPAYDTAFDAFAPAYLHGKPAERQVWAVDQVTKVAQASKNLGLAGAVGFTGSLAFPYLYPWPQRPAGLVEDAFEELARRWKPILDIYDAAGVDFGFEAGQYHPEDREGNDEQPEGQHEVAEGRESVAPLCFCHSHDLGLLRLLFIHGIQALLLATEKPDRR